MKQLLLILVLISAVLARRNDSLEAVDVPVYRPPIAAKYDTALSLGTLTGICSRSNPFKFVVRYDGDRTSVAVFRASTTLPVNHVWKLYCNLSYSIIDTTVTNWLRNDSINIQDSIMPAASCKNRDTIMRPLDGRSCLYVMASPGHVTKFIGWYGGQQYNVLTIRPTVLLRPNCVWGIVGCCQWEKIDTTVNSSY